MSGANRELTAIEVAAGHVQTAQSCTDTTRMLGLLGGFMPRIGVTWPVGSRATFRGARMAPAISEPPLHGWIPRNRSRYCAGAAMQEVIREVNRHEESDPNEHPFHLEAKIVSGSLHITHECGLSDLWNRQWAHSEIIRAYDHPACIAD